MDWGSFFSNNCILFLFMFPSESQLVASCFPHEYENLCIGSLIQGKAFVSFFCCFFMVWKSHESNVILNMADARVQLCVRWCACIIISVSLSWNVKNVNHWVKGHTEMSLLGTLVKLSRLREEKHSAAIFDLWIIPQMFEQRKSYRGARRGLFPLPEYLECLIIK